MMRASLVLSLSVSLLGLPNLVLATDGQPRPVLAGEVCQQESHIEHLLSAKPLICTLGMWRPVRIEPRADGSVKPIFYSGSCKLRLDVANRSNNKIRVKSGEIVDICLPNGMRSQLIAVADSNDFLIAQPPLISNLVIVKPTKKATTSLWIYPVNEYETEEEKFEIQLIGK